MLDGRWPVILRSGATVATQLLLVAAVWAWLAMLELPRGSLSWLLLSWGLCFALYTWPLQPLLERVSDSVPGLSARVVLCLAAIWWAVATTGLTMLFPVVMAFSVSEILSRHPALPTAMVGMTAVVTGTLLMQMAMHGGLVTSLAPAAVADELAAILAGIGCVLLARTMTTSRRHQILQAQLDEQQRRQHEELHYAATHDQLTGLLSRRGAVEALNARGRSPQFASALLFMDLDGFKKVNDTYGHDAGDQLLRTVADRIRQTVPPGNITARMGGDEFIVILHDADPPAVERAIREIRTTIDRPVQVVLPPADPGKPPTAPVRTHVRVGLSIGASPITSTSDTEQALRAADEAMYRDKNSRSDHRANRGVPPEIWRMPIQPGPGSQQNAPSIAGPGFST
ncbi:GGDEF domain-containing protein [Kineosporia mesophila]|uniref:GGDEF domain-containing protein n=1 Tax=Kineosporia mesophila TaxID=566012 RepID=UPI001E4D1C65|nr:GGDEF domain-containing protein [Kineosporia mesophila]